MAGGADRRPPVDAGRARAAQLLQPRLRVRRRRGRARRRAVRAGRRRCVRLDRRPRLGARGWPTRAARRARRLSARGCDRGVAVGAGGRWRGDGGGARSGVQRRRPGRRRARGVGARDARCPYLPGPGPSQRREGDPDEAGAVRVLACGAPVVALGAARRACAARARRARRERCRRGRRFPDRGGGRGGRSAPRSGDCRTGVAAWHRSAPGWQLRLWPLCWPRCPRASPCLE